MCPVCTVDLDIDKKQCQSCEEWFCGEECWYYHFFLGKHIVEDQGIPTVYIEDEVDRKLVHPSFKYSFRNDGSGRNKWVLSTEEK